MLSQKRPRNTPGSNDPRPPKRQKIAPQHEEKIKKLLSTIKKQYLPISNQTLIGPNQSLFQTCPNKFKIFLSNLKKYQSGFATPEIAKFLSKEDLAAILDYFTTNKQKNPTVSTFGPKIAKLEPSESIYLEKHLTGLAHNLLINRSIDGIFDLSFETMNPPFTFKEFLANIYLSQYKTFSKALKKLIAPQNLLKIFDYFTLNNQGNDTVNDFGKKICALEPNEALRLDKHITGLPRTLNILRSPAGEFQLILETKSKIANDTKQILPDITGSFKSGKPAWRIDSGEVEYFNLVTYLQSPDELDDIKNEVALSQSFLCKYIDTKQLGQKFIKRQDTKISIYSEKASCGSLNAFMKSAAYKNFSLEQKYSLLIDIFSAIKVIHQKNYVHQDLKPQNILVTGNQDIGYHASVTDFGTVTLENNPKWAICTLGYQSPEITSMFQDPNNANKHYQYLYQYFNNKSFGLTLAHQHLQKMSQNNFPHQANDMWSLGIITYELLYQKLPLLPEAKTNIDSNPLLKGLLEVNRGKRLTIDQAIDVLQTLIKSEKSLKFNL